jgi:hypothetical protein
MHRWNCLFVSLFVSCLLLCNQKAAASEATLSYQGVLVDSEGAACRRRLYRPICVVDAQDGRRPRLGTRNPRRRQT